MSRGGTRQEGGEEGNDSYTDGPPKRQWEELTVYTTTSTPSSDSPPSYSVDDDFNSQQSETTLTEVFSNETESSKNSLVVSSNNGVATNVVSTNCQKASGSSQYIDPYHKESECVIFNLRLLTVSIHLLSRFQWIFIEHQSRTTH